ncbi:DNA-directed RNA polymerase subunit beta' [Candidatus Collierbacteria bacterium CG1_02_44_10]|uniref:DNA-directed RNA polymerase subunit beta' n=4 Tax=Candidatus Collieribacteriota TaxID=1752725 RepID=A0A2H0DVN2_9BACT|nr:DNA-directed RNA polymerase subunit beta' [bacterium]OIN92827.1 MAG: DNA-directed RNA polymerase subunit beta' [Candidatus Collierbacteria bacterium CG1_02_44_10]PIP85779.1 MAG: DNA-directed RNA polymerase subunit beta' [Candidatus Collierbacteria bacterium CG22_combo_CG10-13_8_21_14_all_43_12]PIS00067.1 MAG: DNA-directed RNA polymerase subunit beta' [Candidatus Collierbacteria bacterium CG10_big_fil_rev_8_21_14_0_10_43_36]PIZ24470.1 MAG: DNA-directed RNA polymerase subunit beta' [Candidatus
MNNIVDFSGLQIRLASPEDIRSWSYGLVTKPETINYRTQKPEKDGLFCERIFGPTKDWECYCGKYKRVRFKGIVCDKCGVEVTLSRVRRERMGHIELSAPVAHVWFFKGAPSKLSLLLDISPKALTSVIYFSKFLIMSVNEAGREDALKSIETQKEAKLIEVHSNFDKQIEDIKVQGEKEVSELKKKIKVKDELELKTEDLKVQYKQKVASLREQMVVELTFTEEIYNKLGALIERIQINSLVSDSEFAKLEEYRLVDWLEAGMGSEALLDALKKVNLEELAAKLKEDLNSPSEAKKLRATKRLQVVRGLTDSKIKPEWMIVQTLPVIPPDLRPMVQLSGGRFAASDLNDLYRRVINRNNRLKHLIDLGAPEIILRNEKRMLQEAVDSLIDSSQARSTRRSRTGKTLKSLSDMLRGKQGRFRQNLLGKRVDYSGRSVIVVGPELKLNQCGLPKDMALEMFKPFVLHELIKQDMAPNVKAAKVIIEKRQPEVFDILEKITKKHPVLLNRAPTLHKLSIQAFWPVLVDGAAIRLHPVVCGGFNADFDGDQMAVHVPLTKKAIMEAKKHMLPQYNLVKPSAGNPVSIPDSKEMAIGVYYLTSIDTKLAPYAMPFSSPTEAITAYETGVLNPRQPIKVRLIAGKSELTETTVGRIIFNRILPKEWAFINHNLPRKEISSIFHRAIKEIDIKRVVRLIDGVKNIGFAYSTISGLSFAISDNEMYSGKDVIIEEGNQKAKEIEENYNNGLITNEERRKITIQMWMDTADDLAEKTWQEFSEDNPVRLIIDTGMGRITQNTIKQLSAMRGVGADPLGNLIELPTKGNFREGLNIFEYVSSIRSSRKGLTDTALRTADAGYLTRRLVDVSHDAIIRAEDCGTDEFVTISVDDNRGKIFEKRINSRFAAKKVISPETHKMLADAGEMITEEIAAKITKSGVKEVEVRSPLTCKMRFGLCVKCYGNNLANNSAAVIGDPAGVIAAQSIGEPGTQLTMRTKHSGGVAGVDVTQGLPRVTELFEVRQPKLVAPISEVSGKVKIVETDNGNLVTVTPSGKKEDRKEYLIPLAMPLKIEDAEMIAVGNQLAAGSVDIKELLKIKGLRAAQNYLIGEIQAIYESQGIGIHDKHFEVIVRKMCDYVRIDSLGDTSLVAGDVISRGSYEMANEAIIAQGGEPATATNLILGTIRAALHTDSWLSAASFQDTTSVLTDAATQGKIDHLVGMKENVIIGRLVPTSKLRARIENI